MLKLWSEDATYPTDQPKDICNICDGYGPLSVRIVQMLTGGVAKSQLTNVSALLPGIQHEERVPTFGNRVGGANLVGLHRSGSNSSIASFGRGGGGGPSEVGVPRQTVLVCYVGGVTYSEVAAYRLLSAQEDSAADYYVCSTGMINASRMFNQMCK